MFFVGLLDFNTRDLDVARLDMIQAFAGNSTIVKRRTLCDRGSIVLAVNHCAGEGIV